MASIQTGGERAGDHARQALIFRIDTAGRGAFLVWVGVALAVDVGWALR